MDQVVTSFEAANMVVNGIVAAAGLGGLSLLSFGSYLIHCRGRKPTDAADASTPAQLAR